MPKSNTLARTVNAPSASPADELAMHIAAVLAHPLTPVSIYNALGDAVHSLETPQGRSASAG